MVKLRQVDHVINEKKVLYSLNYHGFVKLYEIFKSPEDIYLVMNFVNGGELFTYIREKRCLPFEQAKFFFTQTVLAIEHLHMLDIRLFHNVEMWPDPSRYGLKPFFMV